MTNFSSFFFFCNAHLRDNFVVLLIFLFSFSSLLQHIHLRDDLAMSLFLFIIFYYDLFFSYFVSFQIRQSTRELPSSLITWSLVPLSPCGNQTGS